MLSVIAHRGVWKDASEKNGSSAIKTAALEGFGVEIDVRDQQGRIVVAHDPPVYRAPSLREMLQLMEGMTGVLALNIKADGLALGIHEIMSDVPAVDWFVFDATVPDSLEHQSVGNPTFARVSDLERPPLLIETYEGMWVDLFADETTVLPNVQNAMDEGKRVAVVSPELHDRDPAALWHSLRNAYGSSSSEVMICTDYPQEARSFFASQ